MEISYGLHLGKAYLLSTPFARLVQVLLFDSLCTPATSFFALLLKHVMNDVT